MKKRSSRINIEDLPPKYRNQAYEQLAKQGPPNRTPIRRPLKKSSRPDALGETPKVQRFRTPCIVTVHVWKCGGNWDADNIETKAIIDSLVKNGVIPDDSIKEVPEVRKIGHRAKTRAEQRTVIRLDFYE